MKNKILIVVLYIFCSCVVPDFSSSKDNEVIKINYDYYFMEDELINYDIFYSIPYDKLIFTKNEDGFYTNIVSSIYIKDEKNNIVFSDSWSENIVLDFFDQTRGSTNYISNFSVSLKKNNIYTIHIELNDYLNKKHWDSENIFNTRNFEKLSDLKIYFKENDKFLNIDKFQNNRTIDTAWVKYQIIDNKIHENGVLFSIQENSINFKNNNYTIVIDTSMISPYEINLVPISLDSFSNGRVTVNCYYENLHKQKTVIFSNSKLIEYDYSLLLKPMEYLLDKISYIEYNALDSLNKIDFIHSYWNEDNNTTLLDEFYLRVLYADRNFRSIKNKGSQSDKGKIYIIYGKPIDVDYNFTQNGDFEIWYYDDKKFIFINRFGFYECYKC